MGRVSRVRVKTRVRVAPPRHSTRVRFLDVVVCQRVSMHSISAPNTIEITLCRHR